MTWVPLDSEGKPLLNHGYNPADPAAQCIVDRARGLTWELKTSDGGLRDGARTYIWRQQPESAGAKLPTTDACAAPPCTTGDYISAVNARRVCGRSDWRLPSRLELASLVDYHATTTASRLPDTRQQFYWSADIDASDTNSAWGVGFTFGFDYAYPKGSAGMARLVSGPVYLAPSACATLASVSRFQVEDAETTVRDKRTGLQWAHCSVGQQWKNGHCQGAAAVFSLAQARSYVERLPASAGGWRLPSIEQLQTLMETPCGGSAIDDHAFPDNAAAAYWSDTPLARDPRRQWVVNFIYGENDALPAADHARLRLLRALP